jgi:hypothetical protein
MSYQATVQKVMIASPSDVAAERSIVREVLSEWNVVHSDSRRIVLLPIGWETHSIPEMGSRPQALINKQILNDCDLLVGVFWTRIGTSTGEYESGTVEEIEEHIKAGKPVMLYFSNSPVLADSVDADQYARLKSFKNDCKSRGLYESYSDLGEFRSKFYRQIQLKINKDGDLNSSDTQQIVITDAQPKPALQLSREAQALLKACSEDPSGQILHIPHLGGVVIQVSGKNFVEDNTPRSRAKWEGALAELENEGLLEAVGAKRQIFKMTREGYAVADQIAP